MSLVRRNIASNIGGSAIVTLLTLVITPLQVHILGMEAFGVVGFILTLQAAFTAFDFGLSSTLTRELAADPSHDKSGNDPLIRSAMTIYWIMAALLGLAIAGAAGWIARSWFNPGDLDRNVLTRSLQVIALYLALRWPVALYVGLLSGHQRMDVLNLVKVLTAGGRLIGGIAVLLAWRTLEAFLWWTAISAVIEVIAYHRASRRIHPSLRLRPGFSMAAVRRIWRFSLSMNLLGILAILIVQVDRLAVSTLLPLEALGQYTLAYTAASLIPLIIAAISSAVLPWLAAAHARDEHHEMARRYRDADQIMLFLVGGVAFALIAYGEPLLTLWVGAGAAAGAVPSLALLALGFWLSAVVANAYNVAVARGAPARFLKANIVGIVPYAALVVILIGRMGIAGAALAWVVLNIFYIVALVGHVHHRMIGISTCGWLIRTVLPFGLMGVAAFVIPGLALDQLGARSVPLVQLGGMAASGLLYVALFALTVGRAHAATAFASLLQAIRR